MTLYRKVCKSPVFETDNEFGDLFRKFTVMFCPKYLYLP